MKLLLSKALLMAASLVLIATTVQAVDVSKAENYDRHQQKIMYHIDTIRIAKAPLSHVKNHLHAIGDKNADIITAAHSSGAFALRYSSMEHRDKDGKPIDLRAQIAALVNRGVKFEICYNSIRGEKILKEKPNAYTRVIPSGVVEIANLEQRGYVYIKP